jgi:putative SOS response-associated peptidase YedK
MCERFALYSDIDAIAKRFRVRSKTRAEWTPRWNLARGDEVPIIRRAENGRREIVILKWGLEIDYHLIDSSEGPATALPARKLKRAALLQAIFATQRCILPIDAFYATPGYAPKARPWAFSCLAGEALGVAAIWVPDVHGKHAGSFAIATTSPNESVALLSETMPAILFAEDEKPWLSAASDPYHAHRLLKPYPADLMRGWPVAHFKGEGKTGGQTDGPGRLARVA